MRVLIVKTSSMGDVIHTLPALTDARRHHPEIVFDWVVEKGFAEIPAWHPAVDKILPIEWRHWRKNLWQHKGELRAALKAIRTTHYDLIIDAQGLWKSALLARCAQGKRVGYDPQSAREKGVNGLYQQGYPVAKGQHAVERIRQLFALALDYPAPTDLPDYGIAQHFSATKQTKPYVVFLHNTTWNSKLYPEAYWIELGKLANQAGFHVKFTSGNAEEKARADRLAAPLEDAEALSRLSILEAGQLLRNASGAVAVDTGFGHLCAALALPCVSIYGSTNPKLTSAHGKNQHHLHAQFECAPCMLKECNHPRKNDAISPPCYQAITPETVWDSLGLHQ